MLTWMINSKTYLLNKYGDGRTVPCHSCGRRLSFRSIRVVIDAIVGSPFLRQMTDVVAPSCLACTRLPAPQWRTRELAVVA